MEGTSTPSTTNTTIPEEKFSRPKTIDEVKNLAEYNAFTLEKALQANEKSQEAQNEYKERVKKTGHVYR
ncbi:MAG: hypothetical protein WCH65_01815 [bacterium]